MPNAKPGSKGQEQIQRLQTPRLPGLSRSTTGTARGGEVPGTPGPFSQAPGSPAGITPGCARSEKKGKRGNGKGSKAAPHAPAAAWALPLAVANGRRSRHVTPRPQRAANSACATPRPSPRAPPPSCGGQWELGVAAAARAPNIKAALWAKKAFTSQGVSWH